MFVIIDIETCGGKFEYRKGRITEICILKHDGLSVIDKFTTLINPECNISPYFTSLTGITNDMVADAPTFYQVAEKILDMTKDCIFVAHNVGFDYGFVKEEFNSLGYKYKRETLCTVRLSRKLIPNRISYSLGHLCASLGIEIFGRHRAEGDAVATAQLFDLLIQLKSQHPQYKNMGVHEIMARRIDKMKQYILDKLPEECGIYYFLNKENEIIYIGKSNNIYNRALGHFNSKLSKSKKMLNELYKVDHVLTGNELIALLKESEEIKTHKPKYNRQRKAEVFSHCIDHFTDKQGIENLKLVPVEESKNTVLSFTGYSTARERLDSWVEKYELCLRYCGLTGEDAQCFNHQIKLCRGICQGEEEKESYNKRVRQLLSENSFDFPDFLILDRGRSPGEHGMVLVEQGHVYGYGFYDGEGAVTSADEIKTFVKPMPYYPDSDELVKQYLRGGRRKVIKL